MREIVLLSGPPASGKTQKVQEFVRQGYERLNRDTIGGSLDDNGQVYNALRKTHAADEWTRQKTSFVLDNVFATIESRAVAVKVAQDLGMPIRVVHMGTTPEQAQFFAARRQIQRHGYLLRAEQYKLPKHKKDPNDFPPAAQFAYWKKVEPPTVAEGFASVEVVPVTIELGPEYQNKAIIFDFDGTLRDTISGRKYPVDPADIQILPGRAEKLKALKEAGWRLLGASNQSGVAREPGDPEYLSFETAEKCFAKTCELLGVDIEVIFATERGGVPQSYWRKPMAGMLVVFIEKYKLNPALCTFVGDMKTDESAANRAGMKFVHAEEFFRSQT